MAYNEIQQAAFVPNPDADPFTRTLHTLAFPAAWRAPIIDLYAHGRSESTRSKIKNVPIGRLNALMRAVAPDLITVDASTSFDDHKPWLYAEAPYPQAVLNTMIHAWLRDMQPSDEAYPLFRDTVRRLAPHTLEWETDDIDLRCQDVSPGGTALPHDRLYRLVPEILADRIAQLDPYEHAGERVTFHRVAVDARASGAELMSWPPLEHHTKSDGSTKTSYYSGVIRISLRTVPFSATPRVHLSTSIRRWVSGQVYIPSNSGVSTYLLTDDALVPDGARPRRFAVATLAWDRKTRKTVWRQGGPEGLLYRVSALENLPSADVFAKEPEAWLDGRDGVTAGVAFHTRMKWHAVGAGLMPSERRRLTEWAAQALTPEFAFAPPLRRSEIKRQTPERALEKNASIAKDATDEERAQAALGNAAVGVRNAEKRRVLAAATNDNSLAALFLYQTSAMRQHILDAIETSLGLAEHRRETGPDLWSWEAPELAVRLHARPLGALGAPLGDEDQPPRRGQELDDAIRERRSHTTKAMTALCDSLAERPPLVLVELDGAGRFTGRTDPKFAIRLGCADAGMVSQFLRPPVHDPKEEDDPAFRAAAAWGDGLRQIGMRFVPRHTLGYAIPEELNQLAFWLVKRRVDGPTQHAQFTPVAVLIRPGQNCIMGRTARMTEWVPYPELLKNLTGEIRPDDLATAADQSAAVAAFVKNTLYQMKSSLTLVVTHAQNTRNRWPWLQNGGLIADRIQVGGTTAQRIGTHGKHLRIVRVATGDRDETPQWWAPKPEARGGIAKGLWPLDPASENGRVFYSTTDKASTHPIAVDATKLTPRVATTGKPDIKPGKNAWNPDLLEYSVVGLQPGDDPETWAMFVHQQRFSDDYRDGLKLPLILHLAGLTSHYALPHDDELGSFGDDNNDEPTDVDAPFTEPE